MADVSEEKKFCSNCKKDISANNFVMHEAHCFRHIVLCKHCEEPIPKAEIEQHFQDQHEKIPCEKCGQRVEKMHLEYHENDDCPKKPQKCLYCELEFPKSDLKDHLDYCGSRTEQCPICSQFVLFRDQLKHEESNCSYPTPKPPSQNNSSNDLFSYYDEGGRSDFSYGYSHAAYADPNPEQLHGQMNPFVFDEMSRILNNRAEAAPRSSLMENMSQFTSLTQSSSSAFQPLHVHRRNDISQPKQNNFDTWQSRSGAEQEQGPTELSSNPPDGDIDYLLALHLAQDLNSADAHRDTINTFEDEERWEELPSMTERLAISDISPLTSPTIVHNIGVEHEEIPCEFCGEPFPGDVLVQHQSGCELRMSQSQSDDDDLRGDIPPSDINSSRALASNPPAQIPIVNNLSYTGPQSELGNLRTVPDPVEHEETMLPCEFCKALLPLDFLVQHQAVCEAEGSSRTDTPDVAVPAQQQQQPKIKNSNVTRREKVSNIVKAPDLQRIRLNRHQGDPEISLPDFTPIARVKSDKTVNLNNSSSRKTSNGASHLAGRSMLSSKSKVGKETTESQSLGSVPRRRQVVSQSENSISPDLLLRQNRRGQQSPGDGIHDNSSEEEAESAASAAARPKQTSRKAVKQRDNRERQTGSQRTAQGLSRTGRTQQKDNGDDGAAGALTFQPVVRGLSTRQPATSSSTRQSTSTTSSRQPVNNSSRQSPGSSSSTHPRRSGNQVFSGPAKRTPKRRLPDPPS